MRNFLAFCFFVSMCASASMPFYEHIKLEKSDFERLEIYTLQPGNKDKDPKGIWVEVPAIYKNFPLKSVAIYLWDNKKLILSVTPEFGLLYENKSRASIPILFDTKSKLRVALSMCFDKSSWNIVCLDINSITSLPINPEGVEL
jgi:hypothetical protein